MSSRAASASASATASASASAFAQILPIGLRQRTIFVKCSPAPTTFYERRAVLRILQISSSETIETFKKLGDSSSFVAVTTKPPTAQTMIENSPITRTIIAEDSNAAHAPDASDWGAAYNLRGSITKAINPAPPSDATKETAASADLGLSHKTFTLHIFPANKDYNHAKIVSKSPIHGPWPTRGQKSFAWAALGRSIPQDAMAPGLRDWDSGNQLVDEPNNYVGDRAEGAASVLLGRQRLTERDVYVAERARAREYERNLPEVMQSLSAFADKCARRRASASDAQSQTTPEKPTTSIIDNSITKSDPSRLSSTSFKQIFSASPGLEDPQAKKTSSKE